MGQGWPQVHFDIYSYKIHTLNNKVRPSVAVAEHIRPVQTLLFIRGYMSFRPHLLPEQVLLLLYTGSEETHLLPEQISLPLRLLQANFDALEQHQPGLGHAQPPPGLGELRRGSLQLRDPHLQLRNLCL